MGKIKSMMEEIFTFGIQVGMSNQTQRYILHFSIALLQQVLAVYCYINDNPISNNQMLHHALLKSSIWIKRDNVDGYIEHYNTL